VSGSGGDFGPVAPAAGEGPPFAVAGPSAVTLDAARSASVSFTVSNVSGRPVRARVLVLPGAGADASWFSVVGESERALPVAGTTIVDVAVKVSEKAPAGAASFVLGAALEEAPDRVVSSPTVSLQVPPPKPKPFPWWIVIVAVVALLLLVGGGILIWSLTRPDDAPPTDSPTEAPAAEAAALVVSVDGLELVDEQGEPLSSVKFEDGRETLDFLGDALGSTPEGVRNADGYPFTSYDWGDVSILVVDDGGADFRATAEVVEGLDVRTTEGVAVGWSTSDAIDAGAERVYYPGTTAIMPDSLRLQVTPAPGTTSLSNPGETGIDFILLFMQSDEVDQIIAPSNDYSDL
jgi:hypothetical protein